jgi:hypothetical protein
MTHLRPNCQTSLEIRRTVLIPKMNLKTTLLVPAFGLIMSALTVHSGYAQAVPTQAAKSTSIKISSLPFRIATPGTYVLTGNLTFSGTSSNPGGGINISTGVAGPVVVDLKGFTISGPGGGYAITIGVISYGSSNVYPITIRNGTIANSQFGIVAGSSSPTTRYNHQKYHR